MNSLYDAGNGVMIYLSFAMGLFGTLVTQAAVFATGLSEDSRIANWLPAVTIGNIILLVFFAAMSVKNYWQRRRAFNAIRGSSFSVGTN